jgi:tRNA A-37 threonylcarbamoyl transferase component Bud32
MIGRTLGGYRIVEQIGMGGMATVYKAYEAVTDRYVALKVLPQYYAQDPKFVQRFEREARALAKLEHIHILPIFAYGEEEGITYLVMRYMPTGTLSDKIEAERAQPFHEASRILAQIASALDYAHRHDILHRDVKPSNVLLDADGNVYLTDFGLAKMVEASVDLTGGGILGTPAYMSPEQCQGARDLTPATDQYSLGVILYEMITGRTPFQAETPLALIHMQMTAPLPPPRTFRPELPDDAERVLLKTLAREPEARFGSCTQMAQAFAQAVEGITSDSTLPIAETLPGRYDAPTERAVGAAAAAAPTVPAEPVHKRRMPPWIWPVIALLGIGIVAAAIFFGLSGLPFGAGEAGAGAETPPSESVASPAAGTEAMPCRNTGETASGLCIRLPNGTMRVILEDAEVLPNYRATWSPDGSRLVFDAYPPDGHRGEDSRLYIVDADGSNLKALSTPRSCGAIDPAWSPDGERIAFSDCGDLAVIRPDGSDYRVIWWGSPDVGHPNFPTWSPDSRWIVTATTEEPSPPLNLKVMVISLDGTDEPKIVASYTTEEEACDSRRTAFNPDGTHVVYRDEHCQARLVAVDGSGESTLLDRFPYWWTGQYYPQWVE